MKKRKFGSIDELLERAFLGVIKKKKSISEKNLKALFEEIGVIEESDETICWECWGKAILRKLETKGFVTVSEKRFYTLTQKGYDVFRTSEKEKEIRNGE